jgi:hypothetical protein
MRTDEPRESRAEAGPTPKKPYRRPEILYREKLEVMAAICSPAPPAKSNAGMCQSGPISS